jgi:hypothetical protein
MHRRTLGPPLVVLVAAVLAAAPAEAARSADGAARKALSRAAASWSPHDSLALDRAGRLVELREGSRWRLEYRGWWISALNPRWARVTVTTTRDDDISTVLRKSRGRWRALASGGLGGRTGGRRDGAQCKRSGIPALVAVDLGLGRRGSFDPRRHCEGPASKRRRPMTRAELDAAIPTAVSDEWPGVHDDLGDCSAQYPGDDYPPTGFVSRSMPAWSYVNVYCTQGSVGGFAQLGGFVAVLRGGAPVERLNTSEVYRGVRCWSGRALPTMPLRARLELGVCTPMPADLAFFGH